jgi:hypothetical protein
MKNFPRKPKLNMLSGTYVLPDIIRDTCQVPRGVLVSPAREWANESIIVLDLLKISTGFYKNGKEFYKALIEALKTISQLQDTCKSVLYMTKYAAELLVYYKNPFLRTLVIESYKDQKAIVKKGNAESRAQLEGEHTGAVLSKLGAKHLRRKVVQNPRKSRR